MEAQSNFRAGPTPSSTNDFLSRLEMSSPTDPGLSEDDKGSSWGHYQFTSGNMSIKSVIRSWDCVGSTSMACKLIAAAIKICKVARHICFDQGINTSSFLADAYLSNLIDELCHVWVAVGGVRLLIIQFIFLLIYYDSKDMSTNQPRTAMSPMVIDRDNLQAPPSSPPVPPPSSPPVSTIVVGAAPSLVGGCVKDSTAAQSLPGAKDSTAGIKFARPKGGLHVSVSQPHRTG